jgi:sec-independent protein translocase protein TatB
MFDISWTEFLLIGVVALIVIGPKELPGVMRTLGQWTRKMRSMAAEFQGQFQEAMREAEMADLKKQVDDMAQDVKSYDPLKDVKTGVENVGKEVETSLGAAPPAAPAADAAMPTPIEAAAVAAVPGPTPQPAGEFPNPEIAAPLDDKTIVAADTGPAAPDPVPEVAAPGTTERTG